MDCSKTENFMLEWARMCRLCSAEYEACEACVLFTADSVKNDVKSAIETLQKWSDSHPTKTKQSEFLKMFPNVELEDGVIFISPCMIDTSFVESPFCFERQNCFECRKAYWLAEVE